MDAPDGKHVTYQLQYRRCGKPRCTACNGGQWHGPYWYGYWREGGRLRSAYVGREAPAGLDPHALAHAHATATYNAARRLLGRAAT